MAISVKQKKQYETLWSYMEANQGFVYKLISEAVNGYGLQHIDYEDIFQELAVERMNLKPGREHYAIKNKIKTIIRRELSNNNRIEFYLEQALETEDEDSSIAYIDMLKVDNITTIAEDDTVEDVNEFLAMFGAKYRAIIKLKMLGYNQKEIALRLKVGLDEVAEILEQIRLAASIYFNIDRNGIQDTFDE